MLTADTITAHGNKRHGHSRSVKTGKPTPTYRTWVSMLARCNNPKASNYHLYGGRGIGVCDRWQSFENFLADVGERPDGTTLDRFPNPNGNYEPDNVRWATAKQQAESRRATSEWADRPGPKSKTHCKRGHELSGDNVYIAPSGRRIRACVECKRMHNRSRKAQLRELHKYVTPGNVNMLRNLVEDYVSRNYVNRATGEDSALCEVVIFSDVAALLDVLDAIATGEPAILNARAAKTEGK